MTMGMTREVIHLEYLRLILKYFHLVLFSNRQLLDGVLVAVGI